MPKISKTVVDADLRTIVFDDILVKTADIRDFDYQKVNDRQYGVILTDLNGHERYVRIGAIVAEEREDCTARELMEREMDAYAASQEKKATAKAKAAAKAEADAKRRAEKKVKEEAGE